MANTVLMQSESATAEIKLQVTVNKDFFAPCEILRFAWPALFQYTSQAFLPATRWPGIGHLPPDDPNTKAAVRTEPLGEQFNDTKNASELAQPDLGERGECGLGAQHAKGHYRTERRDL